jgi:DNA-binding response OmpR family regulator
MPGRILRFNDTELDVARYELRRNGDLLRLERLPMELLILLASREGELVTREEVIDRLWGKGVYLDAEQGSIPQFARFESVCAIRPKAPSTFIRW